MFQADRNQTPPSSAIQGLIIISRNPHAQTGSWLSQKSSRQEIARFVMNLWKKTTTKNVCRKNNYSFLPRFGVTWPSNGALLREVVRGANDHHNGFFGWTNDDVPSGVDGIDEPSVKWFRSSPFISPSKMGVTYLGSRKLFRMLCICK